MAEKGTKEKDQRRLNGRTNGSYPGKKKVGGWSPLHKDGSLELYIYFCSYLK